MQGSTRRCETWHFLFVVVFLHHFVQFGSTVRVRGVWDPKEANVKIIKKFGFQQIDQNFPKASRGFVYGNITGKQTKEDDVLTFIVVPAAKIGALHSDSEYGNSCGVMMEKIAANGYDAKCNTKGQADIFRWVPCPAGKLCEEEEPVTNSSTLLPDSQLTLQIIEPETPEYWYLVLISCHLDENCTWVASKTESKLGYDLWLTNGNPTFQDRDPFRLQFSFDEQDATQMYLLTLVAYTILCGLIYRGKSIQKKHYSPSRLNLLAYIAYLKTAGVALQSLNMLVFASDGEGVFLARLIGEVLRMVGIDLLCLLLLLLARGWAFNNGETITKCFFFSWMLLSAIKFVLFCCNFIFVYDIVHDVDIFISWPGYGMLAIRIIFALWFLLEVRWLIKRERCHEKAVFLAHFGAGFLVWFVYLPGVGVVAHFISVLWRFKIILGIRTLANFAAIASLVHLFWPYSQYKNHIRTGRTDSNELEDFEKLLFEASDSEGEGDTSPPGRVFNEI